MPALPAAAPSDEPAPAPAADRSLDELPEPESCPEEVEEAVGAPDVPEADPDGADDVPDASCDDPVDEAALSEPDRALL